MWSSLVIVVVIIVVVIVVVVIVVVVVVVVIISSSIVIVVIIAIIIIIIHHELGRHRPVPASSNSLFRSLPSRLLPFGLQFQSSVSTNYYITCTSPHFL